MQELLELILKNITTYPDEVSLEKSLEDGREIYTIKVHPDDMGRVIGKNGKVIQAIRSLAHVISIRQNKRFRINLADSGANPTQSQSDDTSDQPAADTVVEPAAEPEKNDAELDLLSGAIDMDDVKTETPTEAEPKTTPETEPEKPVKTKKAK